MSSFIIIIIIVIAILRLKDHRFSKWREMVAPGHKPTLAGRGQPVQAVQAEFTGQSTIVMFKIFTASNTTPMYIKTTRWKLESTTHKQLTCVVQSPVQPHQQPSRGQPVQAKFTRQWTCTTNISPTYHTKQPRWRPKVQVKNTERVQLLFEQQTAPVQP